MAWYMSTEDPYDDTELEDVGDVQSPLNSLTSQFILGPESPQRLAEQSDFRRYRKRAYNAIHKPANEDGNEKAEKISGTIKNKMLPSKQKTARPAWLESSIVNLEYRAASSSDTDHTIQHTSKRARWSASARNGQDLNRSGTVNTLIDSVDLTLEHTRRADGKLTASFDENVKAAPGEIKSLQSAIDLTTHHTYTKTTTTICHFTDSNKSSAKPRLRQRKKPAKQLELKRMTVKKTFQGHRSLNNLTCNSSVNNLDGGSESPILIRTVFNQQKSSLSSFSAPIKSALRTAT
ncbi:hypothetical protein EJ05DRAFT_482143 [Pseudovirgaria hyperparasitica]|uniref:Uncharacterized protein n=1 Tax=Pseudovirgaria hyperparasitica TaxID=470096 RepID=A0A6A6WMA2_9PEZI|nr:uncharacterized protein EJ05DRAFT_482143 [Pseudovirgaria hyperparasitica]KAF2763334.1 hypothetical protein EJ05DRAFT_482143 [Pseudovirgaria hyperparasitica]